MYAKIKPFLTIVLLLFAGITLAVQIIKEFRHVEPLKLSEGVNVICTHRTSRCPTCLTMERLTKELLDSDFAAMTHAGKITFREVNYEHPEANDFAHEYQIATATVVLVNIQDGKNIAGTNLANEAWKLYSNGPAFKAMLKKHLEAILQGKTIENNSSSDEVKEVQ